MSGKFWVAVDLDGTLAHQAEWLGHDHIGEPIPAMVARVKAWLADGKEVRIFTARVDGNADVATVTAVIQAWCLKHIGVALAVTNAKDSYMLELWDDRAIGVALNTGRPTTEGTIA